MRSIRSPVAYRTIAGMSGASIDGRLGCLAVKINVVIASLRQHDRRASRRYSVGGSLDEPSLRAARIAACAAASRATGTRIGEQLT